MSDIVERLTANTHKYPGFQNMNSEAAAEITRLREDNMRLREENADLRRKLYGVDWEWRKEARDE